MNKVLIVEDDELIAELERDYLEAGGFEVELIFDGNEGLNRAMAGGWDALILDVMLPGKSGFEVCREVRKSLHLPVIMVTAEKRGCRQNTGTWPGGGRLSGKAFQSCGIGSQGKIPYPDSRETAGAPGAAKGGRNYREESRHPS